MNIGYARVTWEGAHNARRKGQLIRLGRWRPGSLRDKAFPEEHGLTD